MLRHLGCYACGCCCFSWPDACIGIVSPKLNVMLTSLVVLGIFLLLVIIYIVWPYRGRKGTMKEKQ